MDHPVTALYDANVLYPAPLRDLLIRLGQAGLVRARWTERIQEEWIRNVLKNRPDLTAERIGRMQTLMNEAIRDCLITGYEELIDSVVLPDPDDRHVLAAAIRGSVQIIVTCNLKDFPREILESFDIEAVAPDDFVASLIDFAPELVCGVVKHQREALRNPPKSLEELLATFESQGLVQTVSRLRSFSKLL